MRSLFLFNPDLSLVATLPVMVKVHIVGAFCLVLLLPFTRLVHFLSVPLQYVWRLLRPHLRWLCGIKHLFTDTAQRSFCLVSR
ncbi:MAG TPA: hypothetical protein DCY91_04430 [Cyanobacteria bacterium UBA11370]|nr:hypothetical protein [Cyanobacteria bacterium UBA11370]